MATLSLRISLAAAVAALCMAPARPAAAGTPVGQENEVAERLMEDANALLDGLVGPGLARALITVEGERNEKNTQSDVETPVEKKPDESGPPAMPGYSPSSMLEKSYKYIQRDHEESKRTNFEVTKMSVSLLVDQSVPETKAEAVKKVLSDMLRLNVLRGDSIVMVRSTMTPAWKRMVLSPDIFKTLASQSILALGLVFVGFFMYLMGVRAVRILAHAILQRPPAPLPAMSPPMELPRAPEPIFPEEFGPPALDEPAQAVEAKQLSLAAEQRFEFLTKLPPERITELLRAEPIEEAALLISYLADRQPDAGTLIFSSLPGDLQIAVSTAMMRLRESDPDRLDLLEERLRTTAERSVQGADKLGRILSALPPEEREGLLGSLSKVDSEGSRRVQESLITFDDLAWLRPEDLRRLVIQGKVDTWASALKDADPRFLERVSALLPAGMRAMLTDVPDEMPKEKITEARSKILSEAFALAQEGQVNLKQRDPAGA